MKEGSYTLRETHNVTTVTPYFKCKPDLLISAMLAILTGDGALEKLSLGSGGSATLQLLPNGKLRYQVSTIYSPLLLDKFTYPLFRITLLTPSFG